MAIPKLDRLKSILMTSGLQVKDPPLFQVIHTLIEFLRSTQISLTELIAAGTGGSSSGGGLTAPINLTDIIDASADSILLGRGDSGVGPWEEITLGTGLSMAGTTLNVSATGSGITVYEQPTEPMGAAMGDFWIVT